MQVNRFYICYLVTTLLISIFVYCLISINLQTMKKIDRIREEVDDIAHLILQGPYNEKTESKYLSDLIDNFIKRRLASIWDNLYSIKKQLKAKDCAAAIAQSSKMQTKVEERVNYAAEELGTKVLKVEAEPICPSNFLKKLLNMDFSTNQPILMLRSSMTPGSCFGFRNHKADVIIKLYKEIQIDQIFVQHLTKKQSPNEDISSAPKDFHVLVSCINGSIMERNQIFLVARNASNIIRFELPVAVHNIIFAYVIGFQGLKNYTEEFLGSFTFDNTAPLQYFKVQTNERFQNLRFKFSSNHGHPDYTCIYRVGVHGKL